MVGLRTLDPSILVRIQVPQQSRIGSDDREASLFNERLKRSREHIHVINMIELYNGN